MRSALAKARASFFVAQANALLTSRQIGARIEERG